MIKIIYMISLSITLMTVMPLSMADDRRVLAGNDVAHGGFLLPELKITKVNNEHEALLGLKGAWLINHRFYLGAAGYGSGHKIKDTNKYMGYGGLLLGYIFNPNHLVSISSDLLIGAGAFVEEDDNEYDNDDYHFRRHRNHRYHDHDHEEDLFSVFEPSINVLLNVTQHLRLQLGYSYRFIEKSNFDHLSDEDVSGGTVNLGIVVGFL